jgi:TetR/AcrR family transcriptional regulator, cholesterol catabolism regulator
MEAEDKILQKASEMFLQLGVRNVTMDTLAGALGISKRTIYEHFKDKDDLVVQSLRHMIIENNNKLLEIIESTDNVVEAIFLIIKRQELYRNEYPKVFVEDVKKYFHEVNQSFYACKEDLKKFSVPYTILDKGVRQGIFRNDLRLELVDSFLHEVITMIHNSERLRIHHPKDTDIFSNILLPYFKGISTRKGLELIDTYFNELNQ